MPRHLCCTDQSLSRLESTLTTPMAHGSLSWTATSGLSHFGTHCCIHIGGPWCSPSHTRLVGYLRIHSRPWPGPCRCPVQSCRAPSGTRRRPGETFRGTSPWGGGVTGAEEPQGREARGASQPPSRPRQVPSQFRCPCHAWRRPIGLCQGRAGSDAQRIEPRCSFLRVKLP